MVVFIFSLMGLLCFGVGFFWVLRRCSGVDIALANSSIRLKDRDVRLDVLGYQIKCVTAFILQLQKSLRDGGDRLSYVDSLLVSERMEISRLCALVTEGRDNG